VRGISLDSLALLFFLFIFYLYMTMVNTFLEKLREYILIRSFIRLPKLNIFFIKKEKIARFLIYVNVGEEGVLSLK